MKGTVTGDIEVLHPGDPDHPGEQVKAAGQETKELPIVLPLMGTIIMRNNLDGDADPMTVDAVETAIKNLLADYGYVATVRLVRTDR